MYGDSRTSSANSPAIFASTSALKREEPSTKRQAFMESDIDFNENRGEYHNNQSISGLLRFRSAPTSLLSDFADGFVKNGDSCAGIRGFGANFRLSGGDCDLGSEKFRDFEDDNKPLGNGYTSNSQLPPQYPKHIPATHVSGMGGSYRVANSMGMNHHEEVKMGSNLMRQNSSPSGLFSHITAQNGFPDLRPSSIRMKSQMNSSMVSRIPENENENINSWNDSSHFLGNFTGSKHNGELGVGYEMPVLSHHLSLPNTSGEMAAMDKLLNLQGTVPFKIRAKRGCATHPRSVAERVRRTRISERMRKLQELVPSMDKQTNTADMLDLAVDYIKDLQKEYKTLSDIKANCKCSSKQKAAADQMP